jgi:cyanate permease
MGTIWIINPRTKDREQITVQTGDIWQDDRRWKIMLLRGIHTDTRARCNMWRRQMVKDNLISD